MVLSYSFVSVENPSGFVLDSFSPSDEHTLWVCCLSSIIIQCSTAAYQRLIESPVDVSLFICHLIHPLVLPLIRAEKMGQKREETRCNILDKLPRIPNCKHLKFHKALLCSHYVFPGETVPVILMC